MKKIPLLAIDNKLKSNWELRKNTRLYILKKGLDPLAVQMNYERIEELKREDKVNDVEGLKQGIKDLGYDPDLDPTNHYERTFFPVTGEDEMEDGAGIRGERDF